MFYVLCPMSSMFYVLFYVLDLKCQMFLHEKKHDFDFPNLLNTNTFLFKFFV